MEENLIIDTDGYKPSHFLQYPPKTDSMFAYQESRGGLYARVMSVGLQSLLKSQLLTPITPAMVDEARDFFGPYGAPFPYEGWMRIATRLGGKLPVRIKAVPEGRVVPCHNAIMTVESTDPETFWVVGWLETMLMRTWYPMTVATQSQAIKHLIGHYMQHTLGSTEGLEWKLHDFGSRGVSSRESAGIGGMAHLVSFQGSDTTPGVRYAKRYYGDPLAGTIPAAEHSTITAWGRDQEEWAYLNMIEQFAKPGKMVAVVSDSYDLFNAVQNIWGSVLKQKVIDSGGTVIIRPDSGKPSEIVKATLIQLEHAFGAKKNPLGFKTLPACVRVIQGDGINRDSIEEILFTITKAGFSTANIAFGMGGALLQKVDRDTQRFAMKCSSITVSGVQRDVYKDPATDPGKRSKAGRLALVSDRGALKTVAEAADTDNVLQTVYEDGKLLIDHTFDQVRLRANSDLHMWD